MENIQKIIAYDINSDINKPSQILRFFGQLISFIFHPLFIPTYIISFLLYKHPYEFAGLNERLKIFRLISIFFSTAFLPAFSVFLMKQLGFIESIFLRTQRDRIIPYMVSMIFYFWVWYVSKNIHESTALTAMLLATFLGCIVGMMANIYYKISMHAISAGVLLAFFLWQAFSGTVVVSNYLAIVIFITGLVCTARFTVSNHSTVDVYTGLLAGMLCQLIAVGFTN